MVLSTLHIKVPYKVHIGTKVLAAQAGTSMNQFVLNMLEAELEASGMVDRGSLDGVPESKPIHLYEAPEQPKTIKTPQDIPKAVKPVKQSQKLCKHGYPLGECLSKQKNRSCML